jgi:hypothetical protein
MKTLSVLMMITGGLYVYQQPVKCTKKPHVVSVNCCEKAKTAAVE